MNLPWVVLYLPKMPWPHHKLFCLIWLGESYCLRLSRAAEYPPSYACFCLYSFKTFDYFSISFMFFCTWLSIERVDSSFASWLFCPIMFVMRSITLLSFSVTPMALVTLLVFWMHMPISSAISSNLRLSDSSIDYSFDLLMNWIMPFGCLVVSPGTGSPYTGPIMKLRTFLTLGWLSISSTKLGSFSASLHIMISPEVNTEPERPMLQGKVMNCTDCY